MAQPAIPTLLPPPTSQGSSLSFTQGFLLGQLSIALLIFFFIKFFIFGEPPSADDRALHLSSLRRARTLAHQTSLRQLHQRTRSNSTNTLLNGGKGGVRSVIRNPTSTSGPSIGTILAKTYYNVKGHQPESLDWFNVLIAQTIAQLRADARQDGAILTSLNELLNGGSLPSWIGEIKVTEIALGDEYPIFSNCRIMPAEEGFLGSAGIPGQEEGRLQARMDVDLSDVITLGIETTLNLNYPKPLVAVLPVALAVSVVRFSGTLALSFIPSSTPPSTTATTPSQSPSPSVADTNADTPPRPSSSSGPPRRPTTLAFTFLDDYRLDLSVRSLVGSRSRLQDVPKIAQLIESRVHAWFDDRVVEPRFQQIVLPSLWPRKKNTRGGDDEKNDEEGSEDQADEGIDVTSPSPQPKPQSSSSIHPPLKTESSLEARIEAEGTKLREAEMLAGERSRSREQQGEGMRWRGDQRSAVRYGGVERGQSRPTTTGNRFNGEWDGMSVSMPR